MGKKDQLREFVEQLQDWHAGKVKNLRLVQEKSVAGTKLVVGDDSKPVEMSEREALFFQLGLEAALAELGKLPFTVKVVET